MSPGNDSCMSPNDNSMSLADDTAGADWAFTHHRCFVRLGCVSAPWPLGLLATRIESAHAERY
jgi:hypothetical protein